MFTYTEIENILSNFIDLIEKGGLYDMRNRILYPSEEVQIINFDSDKEIITVCRLDVDEEHNVNEYNITINFPDYLKEKLTENRDLLFTKITEYSTYLQETDKKQYYKVLSKRVNKMIDYYQNSNPFSVQYSIVLDILREIITFLDTGYINFQPPTERLYIKQNKNTTVLLFTLLKDAGFFKKHLDADIAKFLTARVSYYDETESQYKPIVEPQKLISKFRTLDVSTENALNELKSIILDAKINTHD